MYAVSQAYLTAISSGNVQHIRGELILASGYKVALSDSIRGTPRIEKRCTESEDVFMFGQRDAGPFHAAARKLAQLLQTVTSLIAHGSFLPT